MCHHGSCKQLSGYQMTQVWVKHGFGVPAKGLADIMKLHFAHYQVKALTQAQGIKCTCKDSIQILPSTTDGSRPVGAPAICELEQVETAQHCAYSSATCLSFHGIFPCPSDCLGTYRLHEWLHECAVVGGNPTDPQGQQHSLPADQFCTHLGSCGALVSTSPSQCHQHVCLS
jgi:hypothetical protein